MPRTERVGMTLAAGELPTAPDESGNLPMDRRLDRRAFLGRMTVLTAAVTAGGVLNSPALLHAGQALPMAIPMDTEAARTRAMRAGAARSHIRLLDPRGIAVDDPSDLTIAEAAALLKAKRLSPVELVQACLNRIGALDEVYLAFNMVVAERALAEARRLANEPWSGPLHGIPLAIKDNYYTAGILTTANSHIFRDFVPEFDATVVRRLRGAGGVVLGKTQMGPLATTRATTPDGKNTTVNAWAPHDGSVSPGGSSSGSATSVAARMATSSIGTQTGGSITEPSGRQGLTGLKPTMGRVSLYGVIPLTYTRDHPGPLARDARDAAIMLQTMAGDDEADPRTQRLGPVADYITAAEPVRSKGRTALRWPTTIGVLPGYTDAADMAQRGFMGPPPGPEDDRRAEEQRAKRARLQVEHAEARRNMLETFERMGARVVEISRPPEWDTLGGSDFNNVRLPERSEPFMTYLRKDVRLFGVSLSAWINGLLLPGTDYLHGQRGRLRFLSLVLEQTFSQCDVVLDTSPHRWDSIGLPLITFPIGFEEVTTGYPFPIAAMMAGMPLAEDRLLSLAAAYQDVTDWHRRRPADPSAFPGATSGEQVDRGQPMDSERVMDEGE